MKLSEWPDKGELVMATVKELKDFGVFAELDEYGNKRGFIHISEIASGWVRHIQDYIRENQKVVCKVLKVDPAKLHIDLSLKQVNEHQRNEKIQEWTQEQKAEKLFAILAEKLNKDLSSCYKEFGLQLIREYGNLYLSFEDAAVGGEKGLEQRGFKGSWVKSFVEIAKENIKLPEVEISGVIEITSALGIERIKKALLAAEESKNVTIQYIGAPKHRIVVKAEDYKTAEQELKKALERAMEVINPRTDKISFTRNDKR
ncbi:MAG: translation initiation factor IF-2 subunit alpha [Candidatus Thermoplasmatota archaeon]|nr:translation initiation factor IF-2 subunit alpha [Candidatus Thermoplasmatota archaeon]